MLQDARRIPIPARSDQDAGAADAQPHSVAGEWHIHACHQHGAAESNPWRDVRILGKVAPPKPTAHYTLDEAENIISALVGRVDCQLMFALSFFAGLRPSEIAGRRWEDFDATSVHIRRANVRNRIVTCKTPESVAHSPCSTKS